ncbi:MAG: putative oxygen-independent coproporphyrinogen III oxidase [Candidatus Azotimanducaceae bacterium]
MGKKSALYIHFPWCVRKCPYCDFNSHEHDGVLPEEAYIAALIADLEADLASNSTLNQPVEISSIFMGGGTPSLFSPDSINLLLEGIRQRLNLSPEAEITMEVNPGSISVEKTITSDNNALIARTSESELLGKIKLAGFYSAGVNRLSIGIQSLNPKHLVSLGRIHDPDSAIKTYQHARSAGFSNINIDLMHGLPAQTLDEALCDLQKVIDLQPEHISWYQLTIEPNTVFYKRPPTLPDEDSLWQIYEEGMSLLANNGFSRYEISAFSQTGRESAHNLNYWNFGNYLGIGAGAHGKIQNSEELIRTTKTRHPTDYLVSPNKKSLQVAPDEVMLEYLMNTLRLVRGFDYLQFEEQTGLNRKDLLPFIEKAKAKSLIIENNTGIKPTALGLQYLNELLLMA